MYKSFVKRILDIFLSFLGMIILALPMLMLIVWVKIDDPGPAFFKQKRVGKNKKLFWLYKFRSMKVNTPDVPTHLLENPEQYISKAGKMLRKTSLDELPQLWNIFKGDMSVIGPRPALWNQDDLIAERDKYGANDIRPGLTGWAQINGRDELEIPVKANVSYNDSTHILTDLKAIDVQKCNLQSLDVTNNEALISLNCSDNAFVTLDLTQNTLLETLIGDNLALTKINLSNNAKLSKYTFTDNPELTTIRVHNNFTMDSCLFTSTGNNPSLSIFNTAGNVFYYLGQYSTAFGSAGVVFEITNGGQSGKMVSAEETKLAWSTEKITTEAKNKDDGMANMNTIKAHNHDLSKYPALKWCTDYGTDWYLPSINELRIIHGLSSSLNASINSNPIAANTTPPNA